MTNGVLRDSSPDPQIVEVRCRVQRRFRDVSPCCRSKSRTLFASDARSVRELVGIAYARGRADAPIEESSEISLHSGDPDVAEIRSETMYRNEMRFGRVEGRARETVVVFPSTARSHTCLRAGRSRGAAMTAERGRRSCRERTQRSPPQFEIGQRDVATFHRGRSKDRSNASRRLIARSPSIAEFGIRGSRVVSVNGQRGRKGGRAEERCGEEREDCLARGE